MRPRPAKYVTLVTGCVARPAAPITHRTPGSAGAVVRASPAPRSASRPRKRSRTTRPSHSHSHSDNSRRPPAMACTWRSRPRHHASSRRRRLTHRADRRSRRGARRKSHARPPTPLRAGTPTRRPARLRMARRTTRRRALAPPEADDARRDDDRRPGPGSLLGRGQQDVDRPGGETLESGDLDFQRTAIEFGNLSRCGPRQLQNYPVKLTRWMNL